MLKRYFIDEVTETRASRRQAFSLFSQVNGWADWCSVVRHARLFGGEWREGAALLFVADLPRLPPAPVVVRIQTNSPCTKRSCPSTSSMPIWSARKECS